MAAMKLEAPYYNAIEATEITFENEKIIAHSDSLGHIEFFDLEMNSLGHVDLPVSKDPSEKGHTAQYGDMERYVARWFSVIFDCETKEIKIADGE